MIAVSIDCGLKSPPSQTMAGREKSCVQLSNSFCRCSKSAYLEEEEEEEVEVVVEEEEE